MSMAKLKLELCGSMHEIFVFSSFLCLAILLTMFHLVTESKALKSDVMLIKEQQNAIPLRIIKLPHQNPPP
jgi:hypothetical protein